MGSSPFAHAALVLLNCKPRQHFLHHADRPRPRQRLTPHLSSGSQHPHAASNFFHISEPHHPLRPQSQQYQHHRPLRSPSSIPTLPPRLPQHLHRSHPSLFRQPPNPAFLPLNRRLRLRHLLSQRRHRHAPQRSLLRHQRARDVLPPLLHSRQRASRRVALERVTEYELYFRRLSTPR